MPRSPKGRPRVGGARRISVSGRKATRSGGGELKDHLVRKAQATKKGDDQLLKAMDKEEEKKAARRERETRSALRQAVRRPSRKKSPT
jgi:hypothetical protein